VKIPAGGHFFDAIILQPDFDEDTLDVSDNLEEYTLLTRQDKGNR